MTFFYGILGKTFKENPINVSGSSIVINGIFFTLFFVLMIVAHVQCVITNPGKLPKGYEQLKHEQLPADFIDLIKEREDIFHELIVSKKLRKNDSEIQEIVD